MRSRMDWQYTAAAVALVESFAKDGVVVSQVQAERLVRSNNRADAAAMDGNERSQLKWFDSRQMAETIKSGMQASAIRESRGALSKKLLAVVAEIYFLVIGVGSGEFIHEQAGWVLAGIFLAGLFGVTVWNAALWVRDSRQKLRLAEAVDAVGQPLSYAYAIALGYAVGFYVDHHLTELQRAREYVVLVGIGALIVAVCRHWARMQLRRAALDRDRRVDNELFWHSILLSNLNPPVP